VSSLSDVKADAVQRNNGAIRINSVSHRYGRGRNEVTALGPVDLTVDPGSFLVLVGASGCGKSTLLRLLAGFEAPSEGSVAVSGSAPTPGVTAGVVFQQPRLFPWRTVGGNVDLALKYAEVPRERRAGRRDQLLARVGLEGTADRKIWEISGGQQQRVAIARALANDPQVVTADEPTGNLDSETAGAVLELFRALAAEGRTVVVATHEPDISRLATRIVVLSDGRIVGVPGS
jgi:taurine transport system ATP-binding protein